MSTTDTFDEIVARNFHSDVVVRRGPLVEVLETEADTAEAMVNKAFAEKGLVDFDEEMANYAHEQRLNALRRGYGVVALILMLLTYIINPFAGVMSAVDIDMASVQDTIADAPSAAAAFFAPVAEKFRELIGGEETSEVTLVDRPGGEAPSATLAPGDTIDLSVPDELLTPPLDSQPAESEARVTDDVAREPEGPELVEEVEIAPTTGGGPNPEPSAPVAEAPTPVVESAPAPEAELDAEYGEAPVAAPTPVETEAPAPVEAEAPAPVVGESPAPSENAAPEPAPEPSPQPQPEPPAASNPTPVDTGSPAPAPVTDNSPDPAPEPPAAEQPTGTGSTGSGVMGPADLADNPTGDVAANQVKDAAGSHVDGNAADASF